MSTFLRLEKTLLPPPEIIHWNGGYLLHEKCTTAQKIAYCTKNFFLFTALLIALPLTLSYDWLQHKPVAKIEKILSPTSPNWLPEQRGFATSHFQTQGLGTRYSAVPGLEGKNDWDEWMKNRKHIESPDNFNYQDFFTDIFTNPAPYIDMLKAHNVTAHRFSLEWSVIEPRPGEIDQRAVALYRNFIQELRKAGITPSVTLSHFVMPKWFYESGNFQNMENIDRYVQFALKAIELFPEVDDWWSFNELGVKAFQQAREVYPTDVPEGSSLPTRVYKAGIATRNMLIAHCKLHEQVAHLHPTKKLGVTHQWLTFDTATGNWLERLFAYFFTKFSFTPVYQFFKDGSYSFEFPFMANIQFRVTEEEFEANRHFLQRLGVQAYPHPMIKMGLNHGQIYPGLPTATKNLPFFTFGSTCEPGGTVMRFGPRWNADKIDTILTEAFELTPNVVISEYGSDARVHKWGGKGFVLDQDAQAHYLQQLTERIQNFCVRTGQKLGGLFCWSDLDRQMEWDNGHACRLATVKTQVNANRQMVAWESTPASSYLAGVFGGDREV